MKYFSKLNLLLISVIFALTIGGWGYLKYRYPYGHTHRCSRVLMMELQSYATANEGKFPRADKAGELGMTKLLSQDETLFEIIVGKAGDLKKAGQFYENRGYLRPEDSSWHYVEGLTLDDIERALAWDKIPLGHNGERTKNHSREVIMANGLLLTIGEAEWGKFLAQQKKLAAH